MTEKQLMFIRWYREDVINRATFVYFWGKEVSRVHGKGSI